MKYRLSDEIIFRKSEEGDLLIVNIFDDNNKVYKLSNISIQLFQRLREGKDTKKIVDEIVSEYEVETAKVEEDLTKLVTDLLKYQVLLEEKE